MVVERLEIAYLHPIAGTMSFSHTNVALNF